MIDTKGATVVYIVGKTQSGKSTIIETFGKESAWGVVSLEARTSLSMLALQCLINKFSQEYAHTSRVILVECESPNDVKKFQDRFFTPSECETEGCCYMDEMPEVRHPNPGDTVICDEDILEDCCTKSEDCSCCCPDEPELSEREILIRMILEAKYLDTEVRADLIDFITQ